MDHSKKKFPGGFADLDRQLGRMMRNMSLPGMFQMLSGSWYPAVDVHETENEVIVYVDVSGVEPERLSLTAEPRSITVAGERHLQLMKNISCIHQIEIEHGRFERTIPLPVPVDVNATSSSSKNGILTVRLPKQRNKGKITVKVG